MNELKITVEELDALREVVEISYTNASDEDDEQEHRQLDQLTSLLEKLETHFML